MASGGEQGIRTLEQVIARYTISNRAPSTSSDNSPYLQIKCLHIIYDDYGKITLKNIGNMKLDILIDEETAENYDYTSSIDGETYNKIKLVRENDEKGKREIYIAQDSENMNQWGVLQFFESFGTIATIRGVRIPAGLPDNI